MIAPYPKSLSKECVEEFKAIYEKKYGVQRTYEEASEDAYNLLNFFYLLLQIDRRNKNKADAKSSSE